MSKLRCIPFLTEGTKAVIQLYSSSHSGYEKAYLKPYYIADLAYENIYCQKA